MTIFPSFHLQALHLHHLLMQEQIGSEKADRLADFLALTQRIYGISLEKLKIKDEIHLRQNESELQLHFYENKLVTIYKGVRLDFCLSYIFNQGYVLETMPDTPFSDEKYCREIHEAMGIYPPTYGEAKELSLIQTLFEIYVGRCAMNLAISFTKGYTRLFNPAKEFERLRSFFGQVGHLKQKNFSYRLPMMVHQTSR